MGKVLWSPLEELLSSCALTRFTRYLNRSHGAGITIGDYAALHKWTIENAPAFWDALVIFCNLAVHRGYPLHVSPARRGLPALVDVRWMPDARMNSAENLLRYRNTHPKKVAIVFRPESSKDDSARRSCVTYGELYHRVVAVAAELRKRGVRKGDHVVGVVSNTPYAVVAMLASMAIGAVWGSCSPDFGVEAIVARFAQIKPRVMFVSPAYVYKGKYFPVLGNVAGVVKRIPELRLLVLEPSIVFSDELDQRDAVCALNRLEPACVSMLDLEASSPGVLPSNTFPFELVSMEEPVLTMFSSGTTGAPKCLAQGSGVLLNHVKEHVLHHNVSDQSVVYFSTTTGWMMFPWLCGALATGATIVLYDGAAMPPRDPMRMLRIADEEGVSHFGASARLFQAFEDARIDPNLFSLHSLCTVMATGSPSTEANFKYMSAFGTGVTGTQYVSMSGGTELNGCLALGSPWKPVIVPQLQAAGLGMDVRVLDTEGKAVVEEKGELVCLCAAPCMPLFFWNDKGHQRYRASYFETFGESVWAHGDFAVQTASSSFIISGRSDATLNPGGVRIGTGDIYQVLDGLSLVRDAVVVGQKWKGDIRVILFVVPTAGGIIDDDAKREIRSEIRHKLSPRHIPALIVAVEAIPMTFSNKKCEVAVKRIVDGEPVDNRDAIQNPNSLDSIKEALNAAVGRFEYKRTCSKL